MKRMKRLSAGVLTFNLKSGGKLRQVIIVRGWLLAGLGLQLNKVRGVVQGNLGRYSGGKPIVTGSVEILDYIRKNFSPTEMLDNGLKQIVSLVPTGRHFEAIMLTAPLVGCHYGMVPHQRLNCPGQRVGISDGFVFLVDRV